MRRRLMLALVPAVLAFASFAHAQPAAPDGLHGRRGPPTAEMRARHEAMRQQRLEDLKTILRLRPDQEPALAAFMEAHRPPVHEFDGPPEPKALTTPQRLDEMARREAEMAARHERMRQALAKFYAALSPEQQKVFDALLRLHASHDGPMGDHRMMMRRDGPDGPMPGHEPPL